MSPLALSIAAALLGPIAAVVITLWWQRNDRDYQRRLAIFQAMMRTRRHQLSPDWVGAFNLVPVEFANDRQVIESFNRLLDRYSDSGWRGTPQQVQNARENVDTAASELLHRMALSLRINLRGLDLRRAYAPEGWATDEDQNRALRTGFLQLVGGQRPLRVRVDTGEEQQEHPPAQEPQSPL